MYTRNFDSDDRLKIHRVGSDTRTLTYDAASRITQTTDTNPVTNRTYDYDELDRQQNIAGPVTKTNSYDAAGNPLSDGATTFTWNAAGKLSVTVKNARTHTYKTNALDQRISKNGPLNSKFFFFYDPAGQLIAEYRDNASTATPTDDWLVRQETIWLEDIPVAVIQKATTTSPILVHFIHADHLNTPRVIVNQNNTPVWRWENTHAFGANLPDENPDGNSQLFEYHPRFPGQYFDKETGLHYNYFRYYEPETGRYISPDPIGLMGGMNVYGYGLQDPLRWIDPLGLASLVTHISVGTTTFDPRPEDPSGIPFTIQTRNGVDRRHALPGAQDAFSTPNVRVRYRAPSKSYGPNGAYIDTGDTRYRNIHGGGSCPNNNFGDSQAPRQGWCVTLGCTRGQNEDVINLGIQIEDFQRRYPGTLIPYTRH